MSHHKKTTSEIQLSVIVLFYHGENWIKPCMESLENQSLPRNKYEIILADNGGSTPSVRKYEGRDNTKALYFNKNQGFAGGNNMAIAHAEGEFIVLMNQDVVVHFNCLDVMVSDFERNSDAGVISANMIMVTAGDKIDYQADLSGTVGLYRLSALGYASYYTKRTNQEMIPVEFVSGNALCFRRNILKDVGNYLFDARLGSYAEDLDLSIRLKKTVWQMYVRPRAVVYHYRDDAFSGRPVYILRKLFQVSSNRLLVYFNNLPISKFSVKLPALVLGIPFKVTRPDGSRNFSLFNFFVALGCVPFILIYFSLRALRISKFENKNPITTRTPPTDNK
jgi:N-acetylglucosaminyl-diphospho-decaprenol L-rhamnosyltransferase